MPVRSSSMMYSGAALTLLCLMVQAGCRKPSAVGDYERMKRSQQEAAAFLREKGVKLTEQKKLEGQIAFAATATGMGQGQSSLNVNCSGMDVTDEIFDSLKKIGYITELNLSKTNVGDAEMARVNEREVGSLLTKLNLSNTAVTDAGLAKLDSLLLLTELNLAGTKVTAAGVENFKKQRANDPKINMMFRTPTIKLK
jgi:hypothetical protein